MWASTTWDASHVHLYHTFNPDANNWSTSETVSNPWTTYDAYTCLTIRLLLPNAAAHIVKWMFAHQAPSKMQASIFEGNKRATLEKPPLYFWRKKILNPSFFFKYRKKEKVYDVLNPNFVELCYSRRWVRTDFLKKWIEELNSVTFVDTRETFQTPTKSAPSFRNVLEKIHIEVTHKINNFALKV